MPHVCQSCGYDPSRIVTASWSFFVPLDASGMNARLVNAGPSRWAYAKERDRWTLMLRNAMQLNRITVASDVAFRRLTMTRCYFARQRPLDHANFVGGMKGCTDVLVKLGAIFDDSPRYVTVNYKQERSAPTGVRFALEEIAA